MPNWDSTHFIIEGPRKQVASLYNLLYMFNKPARRRVHEGMWVGVLMKQVGLPLDTNMKTYGSIRAYSLEDKDMTSKPTLTLHIYTETPWQPEIQPWRMMMKKLKMDKCQMYFQSEETGTGYYVTNDKEKKYFKDRWIVDVADLANAITETEKQKADCFFRYFHAGINRFESFAALIEAFAGALKPDKDIHAYCKEGKTEEDILKIIQYTWGNSRGFSFEISPVLIEENPDLLFW